MMTETNTDRFYLPARLIPKVQNRCIEVCPGLAAAFLTRHDLMEESSLGLFCWPVADCIRNLTHRFPDGPTYFVLTRSEVPTAMIARFGHFQCIVLAEALAIYFSVISARLLVWPPLVEFLNDGHDLEDDGTLPVRSRHEALIHVLRTDGPVDPATSDWRFILTYFLAYMLTAHELGHLALGHLGRPRDVRSMSEMAQISEKSFIQSRAMEWEADGFGAMASAWHTGASFDEGQPFWRDLVKDGPTGLRVIIFGAYLLFSIMDLVSLPSTSKSERTHPAPMVRISLMIFLLTATIDHLSTMEGEEVMEIGRRAIKAVELALNAVGGGMMQAEEALALGEEAFESSDDLINALNQLREHQDRTRLSGLFWASSFGLQMVP